MLAKTYRSPKDLILPAQVTEKLDGVAADFYGASSKTIYRGKVLAQSRQGEPLYSVDHIRYFLTEKLPENHHLIGELYISGADFKDISGYARRQESDLDTAKLNLYIYDYYIEGQEDMSFKDRMETMTINLLKYIKPHSPVKLIPGLFVDSIETFTEALDNFRKDNPTSEGIVIRALEGPKSIYKTGWRSPGMLKLKTVETLDLPIVSFEEAISKDGEPLKMVGRINVKYKDTVIGVGPGKMKHQDRGIVWQDQQQYIGKHIEVTYMPDDSYDALREPRFYRFRPDKD